jgi:hypothetical protein
VVVSDFTEIGNMTIANKVFDAIDMLKWNATPGSPEDFDFFVTNGDNLYPKDPANPTSDEFAEMMSLFLERPSINRLDIYPVRGNHDCMFHD